MPQISLLLENCRIATTTGFIDGSISVEDGKIIQISRTSHANAEKKIDLHGKLVIPGVIDPHVHFRDPGKTHKEDFKTGSLSALFGGVTTIFDMPNNEPITDSNFALDEKRKIAQSKSYVDYALYCAITNENLKILPRISCNYFKAFASNPDICTYETLQKALKVLDKKIVRVHAEDPETIKKNEKKLVDARVDVLSKIRSVEAEVKAVEKILSMDFGTNKISFCHITSKAAIDKIRQSRKHCSIEVTPHHLFLDTNSYKALDTYASVQPPLRDAYEVSGLWSRLGYVNFLGSDHAPHTKEEKEGKILEAKPGFPGVETMLPLLVNAVNQRKLINWHQLVKLTSHGVMEAFGLKEKGEIAAGKDADLVVLDNKVEWVIDSSELHSKCGWSPYDGFRIKGRIEKVFLHGELVLDDGELLGRAEGGEIV